MTSMTRRSGSEILYISRRASRYVADQVQTGRPEASGTAKQSRFSVLV